MQTTNERIFYLLDRYTSNEATDQEVAELMEWMAEAEEESELRQYVMQIWNAYDPGLKYMQVDWDQMFRRIVGEEEKPKLVRWKEWMAAAAVIGFMFLGLWFIVGRDKKKDTPVAVSPVARDVDAPGETKAVITLANGRKVLLDSLTSVTEANVNLTKVSEGEVDYKLKDADYKGAVQYNTLYNPRGSKVVSITLSDGTKVWLNSESTLQYPVAFTGIERKVMITGEAYFEVAHNPKKPFHVTVNEMTVQVLGTHFNINSYADEGAVKTTLLEGSIRVAVAKSSMLIKPGQQAQVESNNIRLVSNVDTDAVMAWKEQRFYFYNDDINTIMRQLGRWYDIHVVYDEKLENRYTGIISRDVPISKVLRLFEKIGDISFEIKGTTVHVRAAK